MPFGIIGSSNTITADMPVPHPDTKPCVVTLFQHYAFRNFNNQTFSYSPTQCKGPWAEVVFNFDVNVSKGVQFDRTGIIWLDGAVIYFGTTAEPSPTLAPHWHVERDVTDLSALFRKASQGQIELGNLVNSTYSGVIHGTAYVQFYPADRKYPAPRVPDEVIGIPYSPPLGGATQLPQSPMEIETTVPRNIVGADLELYLQSQDQEEQWFMCVPTDVWNRSGMFIGQCPHTAFREGEVSVNGIPAGTAPIYPWIYAGGLNPYLWTPIPGVQTLEFEPYRVSLTPFAAKLSDGTMQTITVSVFNAFDYFTGAGDLLLYRDSGSKQVTGKLVEDTLAAKPRQNVRDTLTYGKGGLFQGPTARGHVYVSSERDYVIRGYVNGSQGRAMTTVHVKSSFSNEQKFLHTHNESLNVLSQDMILSSVVTTVRGGKRTVISNSYDYPLFVSSPVFLNGNATRYRAPFLVYQGLRLKTSTHGNGSSFSSYLTNTIESNSTLIVNKQFNLVGVARDASQQLYTYKDSAGSCYGRNVVSVKNVVNTLSKPGCSAVPPPPPPLRFPPHPR